MPKSAKNRRQTNWWPVGIALSSAVAILFFQNCSVVHLTTSNPSLSASSETAAQQEKSENSERFPANEEPPAIPSESTN